MQFANIAKASGVALRSGALVLLGILGSAGAASAEPKEVGIWYDDTGQGAVKIEICTPTTLCGRIYWLKEPLNAKGQPKTDKYNPEDGQRARKICGLPIMGDLKKMSDGGFDEGWIYDPKVGKSYSVALDLLNDNKLKVTGYKGIRMLGKSFVWTRAPDDLEGCDADSASAR